MRYLKVLWAHQSPDEPVELLSEIDSDGWEIRKIETFRDGATGYADADRARGSTALSLEPIPPIEEINNDEQFSAKWIDKNEFEATWANRMVNVHGEKSR
jgi:hypothetical protein